MDSLQVILKDGVILHFLPNQQQIMCSKTSLSWHPARYGGDKKHYVILNCE